MATPLKIKAPTRFAGGVTNTHKRSLLSILECLSPAHEVQLGWAYHGRPGLPTGNTPVTNADYTVTSVTSTGTASLNPAAVFPPTHLLTTGTTINDQVVIQDKRSLKKNLLTADKVLVAGSFQVTSTVANQSSLLGLFSGTSLAALGNDQFGFNLVGATLSFVNRNNGGTALSTTISSAILINVHYGVIAVLDKNQSKVYVAFGVVDGTDLTLSTRVPQLELPITSSFAVTTSNIVDGTNSVLLSAGSLTSAAAAATVQFGPCFAVVK